MQNINKNIAIGKCAKKWIMLCQTDHLLFFSTVGLILLGLPRFVLPLRIVLEITVPMINLGLGEYVGEFSMVELEK